MKVINVGNAQRDSLLEFLKKRLAQYRLLIWGRREARSWGRSGKVIQYDIMTEAPNSFLGGVSIGCILPEEPNNIILFDRVYLKPIKDLALEYEKYNPAAEVTIEIEDLK